MDPNATTKICSKCKVEKPLVEFSKGRYVCKSCDAARQAAIREKNSEISKRIEKPTEKLCPRCKRIKLASDFSKCSSSLDGMQPKCRDCDNKAYAARRTKNTETNDNGESIEEKKCGRCGEIKKAIGFSKCRGSKDGLQPKCKKCSVSYCNDWIKRRRSQDPLFKLECTLRAAIHRAFSYKGKPATTKELLGCSIEEAKIYLTGLFYSRIDGIEMSWDKLGVGGVVIDHVVPLASAKTEEEIRKLCHITNLQPLWEEDNSEKRDRLDWEHPGRSSNA